MDALERANRSKKRKQPPAPPRIEIYECDDWVRVYVDGKRVTDGHDLSVYQLTHEVLPALGITWKSVYFEGKDLGEYGDDFEGAVERARKS